MWFRRDLRILDHPALMAAIAEGPVVPVFVIDPHLWEPAGDVRLSYLCASLRSLHESLGGKLVIHHGSEYKVMTNSPTFDKQLSLNGYWQSVGGQTFLPGPSCLDQPARTDLPRPTCLDRPAWPHLPSPTCLGRQAWTD